MGVGNMAAKKKSFSGKKSTSGKSKSKGTAKPRAKTGIRMGKGPGGFMVPYGS